MRAVYISMALGFGFACKPAPTEEVVQPELQDIGSQYDALSPATQERTERTRAILEERCGSCHRPDQEGALPEILAVFNLAEEVWWRNMTASQWSVMVDRLEGQNLMTEAKDVRELANEAVGGPVEFSRPRVPPASDGVEPTDLQP